MHVQQCQQPHGQQHGQQQRLAHGQHPPRRAQRESDQCHHAQGAQQCLRLRLAQVVRIHACQLAANLQHLRAFQACQGLVDGRGVQLVACGLQGQQRGPAAVLALQQQGIDQRRQAGAAQGLQRDRRLLARLSDLVEKGRQPFGRQRPAARGFNQRGAQRLALGQAGQTLLLHRCAGQPARDRVVTADQALIHQRIEPCGGGFGVAQRGLQIGALHDDQGARIARAQVGAQRGIQIQRLLADGAERTQLGLPQPAALQQQHRRRHAQGQQRPAQAWQRHHGRGGKTAQQAAQPHAACALRHQHRQHIAREHGGRGQPRHREHTQLRQPREPGEHQG